MAKWMFFFLVFTVFLALPAATAEVRAVRVEQGPKIDGSLADPAWQAAAAFTGFRMADPLPGAEPTERTELRIVYDDANLYIGVRCLDGEPTRIAAHSMAHDGSGGGDEHGYGGGGSGSENDDVLRVLIDPFMDKRTAYFFSVNPRGARSEGLTSGGEASLNWDGIWDAASRIDGNGWSAEFRIPFKTISFNPGLTSWGINIERFIARKQEIVRLAGTDRDSNFYNPMAAAALSGIVGVKQGRGITFRPYGLVSVQKDFSGSTGSHWKLDGGFDVYKNFTPNLVGACQLQHGLRRDRGRRAPHQPDPLPACFSRKSACSSWKDRRRSASAPASASSRSSAARSDSTRASRSRSSSAARCSARSAGRTWPFLTCRPRNSPGCRGATSSPCA